MSPNELVRVSPHVHWLTPGPPDRPSLAAVVGTRHVLLLDAGASDAHADLLRERLAHAGVARPSLLALSHWHWDHVFGAARLGLPTIAQRATARHLARLAGYAWTDEALAERVARGSEIPSIAEDIAIELPEPREVRIHQPEIVIDDRLELRLGGVTCVIEHVGGDHSDDACVMHVPEDGLLFLGDCLYEDIFAPLPHFSAAKLLPLIARIEAFGAETLISGHGDALISGEDLATTGRQIRLAAALLEAHGPNEDAVMAAATAQDEVPIDEDFAYYLQGMAKGMRSGGGG